MGWPKWRRFILFREFQDRINLVILFISQRLVVINHSIRRILGIFLKRTSLWNVCCFERQQRMQSSQKPLKQRFECSILVGTHLRVHTQLMKRFNSTCRLSSGNAAFSTHDMARPMSSETFARTPKVYSSTTSKNSSISKDIFPWNPFALTPASFRI